MQPPPLHEVGAEGLAHGLIRGQLHEVDQLRAALAATEAEGRVPVVSEVDLFLRLCPAATIGVTGTKGKTTTSALTAAVLAAGDPPVVLGGNIGIPLIERLPEAERYTYVFRGGSQAIDHILVSPALAPVAEVDVVHVNADFPARDVDEDRSVLDQLLPPPHAGLRGPNALAKLRLRPRRAPDTHIRRGCQKPLDPDELSVASQCVNRP